MGDERFLLRQFQTSGFQEITNQFFGLFGNFLCGRRYDKIIGIPHQIYLVGVAEPIVHFAQPVGMEPVGEQLLHPIQRHIRQNRRDNAALGRTRLCGKQLTLKYKAGFQELLQN